VKWQGMNIPTVSAIELAEAAPANVVMLAIPDESYDQGLIDPSPACGGGQGGGPLYKDALIKSSSI